jgi:hypothetical protein
MSDEPAVEPHAGRWVARRFVTHEVVLAADSPEELDSAIRAQGLRDVAVMRMPTDDEPLWAGLGHRARAS